MYIEYANYSQDNRIQVIKYNVGGFVPSPIINKGEEVGYVLAANGIENVTENLPDGYEINLIIKLEVISIYNRIVIQSFLLRLQRHNANFNAGSDKRVFWNYCFESEPIYDLRN